MFGVIYKLDKGISSPIIKLDNIIVSILLYPFAAFFHPKLIFLAYASVYYLSNYHIPKTIIYLLGTAICLITTTLLKKILKRYIIMYNLDQGHSCKNRQKNHIILGKSKRITQCQVVMLFSLHSLWHICIT